MMTRILKARDIERLENTSFANVPLVAVGAPTVSVSVHESPLSNLTQFLAVSERLDAGCDGSASCTGDKSCTGGDSCTADSCSCYSCSNADTCCPLPSIGSCGCQDGIGADHDPGAVVPEVAVFVAKPLGWQI